jgi:hypothetical protein
MASKNSTLSFEPPTLLVSEGVARARRGGEIPEWAVTGYATSQADGNPYAFPAPTEEVADEYIKALRAAAKDANGGLAVSKSREGDEWIVDFQAKARKQRKYTAQDVREWAEKNVSNWSPDEPLTADVRKAYREARGL